MPAGSCKIFKWRCVVIYLMRSCVCRLYFPTVLFSFALTHWFEDINFYLYIVRICFRPLLIFSISFVRYESYIPCIRFIFGHWIFNANLRWTLFSYVCRVVFELNPFRCVECFAQKFRALPRVCSLSQTNGASFYT